MKLVMPDDVFYAAGEIVKVKRGRWQGDLAVVQEKQCGKNLSTYLVRINHNGVQQYLSFADIEPWFQVGRVFESCKGDRFKVEQIVDTGQDKQVCCINTADGYARLFWQDGKADEGSDSLIFHITAADK